MSNAALKWAYEQKLGSMARKAVLISLAEQADDRSFSCWPGQQSIADRTECGIRTVRRSLAELERDGLIARRPRFDSKGHRTSDSYVLAVSSNAAGQSDHRPERPEVKLDRPPATDDRPPATVAGEPSVEPSVEPSEGGADATTRPKSRFAAADEHPSETVLSLCNLLADLIEDNGSKRPKVGTAWFAACRLLMDIDGRDAGQIERAIRWCQQDEFWRANVMSMPKLREKYDQLRLAAQRPEPGRRREPTTRERYERDRDKIPEWA